MNCDGCRAPMERVYNKMPLCSACIARVKAYRAGRRFRLSLNLKAKEVRQ